MIQRAPPGRVHNHVFAAGTAALIMMYDIPMEAVQRASAFLFYTVGTIAIVLIVLAKRGMLGDAATPYLHILDLPILLIAMLYGGSSLYTSLSKGKKSLPLLMVVVVPLGVLFAVFAWFNFAVPFAEF
jgi:hypothetical protein